MNCNQWIFDMDGTLTDSMTAVWENAPLALLRRYGRTPRADLRSTLLSMGMADGAQYLIREYALPLRPEDYFGVMRSVIAELYETVELKPGVRELLTRLRAEGARMCICSNTWSDQCKTVLTRLGVDDCFEFYIEAQGPLHKSRPDVFFAALQRLGGTDPYRCAVCEDSLYAARTAHDAGFYVIGIADGAIEAVGSTTEDVVMALLGTMEAEDADTLTILAGEDMGDDAFDALIARIEDAYDDLEIDAHRGDQPLYPVVMSVE